MTIYRVHYLGNTKVFHDPHSAIEYWVHWLQYFNHTWLETFEQGMRRGVK